MMTIGDVGKLVITQNDDSNIITKEILDTFIENGIKAQIHGCGKIRMDVAKPYLFDKAL